MSSGYIYVVGKGKISFFKADYYYIACIYTTISLSLYPSETLRLLPDLGYCE